MAPHANDFILTTDFTTIHSDTMYASNTRINGHINSSRFHPKTDGSIRPKTSPPSQLHRLDSSEPYDLIAVGFGPANLALAIAMNDALDRRTPISGLSRFHDQSQPPRVLFLEKQRDFGWHKGMLLPGATMQISFLKDLATLRDPRSAFTFINYLHSKRRLVQFTNLDTFLPRRTEYHDYMSWCASAFDEVVEYSQEVREVRPVAGVSGKVSCWQVQSRSVETGNVVVRTARHVVIAVGGSPKIPAPFPQQNPRVIHSSMYATTIGHILQDKMANYRVAVVGSGQSAAEIFNDLHTRYPYSQTRMLIKHRALKPSDDSPFVNEIFDPERVDEFYNMAPKTRDADIAEDKSTNYGVVRLGLLEHIYETLYSQRMEDDNEGHWQHRILVQTSVLEVEAMKNGIILNTLNAKSQAEERMEADVVIVAAGYGRDMHEWILEPSRGLMPGGGAQGQQWSVGRDYKLDFRDATVQDGAGIWLSGCNECTHGLSDTLLSILSVRGGEMVRSIFGDR